ncbi:TetR/AcrR family transcriptional regulator [Enemella sp. A6]|uniref:TetR/AcrR family transcriptional regulator n=1 Tax=Enemella sp. A6 TaxID=3440152 RepID=UPI003EB79EF7
MTQLTARRERTRERLLEAARSVFAEKGVQAASVEEICERAGFTRGAFYSNFESKNDLTLAYMVRVGDSVVAGAREAVEGVLPRLSDVTDMDALIDEGIRLFLRTQDANLEGIQAGLELRLHASRVPEMRDAYLELVERSHNAIAEIITEALEVFGWEWALDPSVGMRLLHGVYEQSALETIISGGEADAVTPLLGEMMLAMVRPKGA